MNPKIFPTCLIILSVLSAAVYASTGDVRRTIYWMAAATLNAAVTF